MTMDSKNTNDSQSQYLLEHSVYTNTTTEINFEATESETNLTSMPFSSTDMIISKRSFERRGLLTVVCSTLIVTMLLITYVVIHTTFARSYFIESSFNSTLESKSMQNSSLEDERIKYSSWKTTYDLPDNVTLLEINSSSFNFNSDCPNETFALVLNLETSISTAEQWIAKCGYLVRYFRINSDYEIEDVDKIIGYVSRNAQYIPIKVSFTAVPHSYNILADPRFQNRVAFEGNIINSLTVSGPLTASMIKDLNQIVPFVEELTIEGSDSRICSTLHKEPRDNELNCAIYWDELKKLKLHNLGDNNSGDDCSKLYRFIDSCWKLRNIELIEIKESVISNDNVGLIERIVDKHRITSGIFEGNNCTGETKKTHEFICDWPEDAK